MSWLVDTLRSHPELAIFLTLGLGYLLGGIKVGSFSLGSVTGVLLAGVLVGQMSIEISAHVKSVFFLFFLFAVGYGVGPQFVRGIAKDGAPQALFAVIVCLLCLAAAFAGAVIMGYGVGLAAGMYAGATTISASIGLATDAIHRLGLPEGAAKAQLDLIPVAYAVTYIFGTVGTGWILAFFGPKLLGVDLAAACKDYEHRLSAGGPAEGMRAAWHRLTMRAFRVKEGGLLVGKTVREVEALPQGARVFVERMRRGDRIVDFDADTVIRAGDVLALSGPTQYIVQAQQETGAIEVADAELLSIPVESIDVVVTSKAHDGKTLLEASQGDFARGVFLNKITRGATSVDIPILPRTAVHRGDILNISGTKVHTDRVSKTLGYAVRPSETTDMVWVGLAVLLGGLLGALVLPVGGVPITLSTSGGALLAGITLGWLRGVRPTFGSIPPATLWFMNSVGLNVFIAIVGITAGPTFISGLQEAGVGLFFVGVAVTSIPMLAAPLLGRFVFRFDPAINLGCCGGARTSTASAAMIADVAKSNVPALGYTVPYAVSNALLTMWGMILVLLLNATGTTAG